MNPWTDSHYWFGPYWSRVWLYAFAIFIFVVAVVFGRLLYEFWRRRLRV